MKRPDDSVLFGIRKGIAIYFNDVIEKDRIKEIVRMLVDMTGVTLRANKPKANLKSSWCEEAGNGSLIIRSKVPPLRVQMC